MPTLNLLYRWRFESDKSRSILSRYIAQAIGIRCRSSGFLQFGLVFFYQSLLNVGCDGSKFGKSS